jgi:hypothetical protein
VSLTFLRPKQNNIIENLKFYNVWFEFIFGRQVCNLFQFLTSKEARIQLHNLTLKNLHAQEYKPGIAKIVKLHTVSEKIETKFVDISASCLFSKSATFCIV